MSDASFCVPGGARRLSRRDFVRGGLTAAAAAALTRGVSAAAPGFGLELGYAAITWRGDDDRAIDDIASVGFRGIQLRSNVIERFGEKPGELRRRLEDKGLSLTCFSSGSVDADPARASEYRETQRAHARFVEALDGRVLQLLSRRPTERPPTPAEFERLGRLLTEIGRDCRELGVSLVYHNHMNAFGEAPDEVAKVLEVSEPRYVSLLLDIAHYQQGGGDPVAAVERHKDRITILHLKDVVSPLPGDARPARQSYRFVELGAGHVDVPGVIAALKRIGFNGPAVIELDRPPDPARTAKDYAALNRKYVTEKLGLEL